LSANESKSNEITCQTFKNNYFFAKIIAFIQNVKNRKGYLHISMKIALLSNKLIVQYSCFRNFE